MAWNQPGNNNKKRDPWQDGDPPDLEEALKNMKDRLGRIFNGGGGGGASGGRSNNSGAGFVIGSIIAIAMAIWLLTSTWVTIDESERGVVLRFGKFNRVLEPGLGLKLPSPIETVTKVESLRVRSISEERRMLTADENFVIVDYNVQYQATTPRDFLYNVRSPEETLQQVSNSAVRQVVGGNTLDSVLSGERTKMAADAKEIMQKLLGDEGYATGIVVTELNFQNVRPPDEVKKAFDDAIAAREDNQRIKNEAEAYRSKVEPEARGVAQRLRTEAEGYKTALIATATGEAKRFDLLVEQYQQAPQVTRKRLFLETMQEVLSKNPKVMVDVGGGNQVMYLPLDKLMRSSVVPTIIDPKRDTSQALPERAITPDMVDPLGANREPRQ